jgi:hypothetical protein
MVAKTKMPTSTAHITLEVPGRLSGEPIRIWSRVRGDAIPVSYQDLIPSQYRAASMVHE